MDSKKLEEISGKADALAKRMDARMGRNDATPAEIDKEYNQLRSASRDYLERQVAGKLSTSGLSSVSKADLINQILNDKFRRKDLDAWGK